MHWIPSWLISLSGFTAWWFQPLLYIQKHTWTILVHLDRSSEYEKENLFPGGSWVYLAHKHTLASALVKKSVLVDVKFYSSSDLTQLSGLHRNVCCGLQEISSSPGRLLNLGSVFWQKAIWISCRTGCGFSSRIVTFLQETTGRGNFNFSYWTWNHLCAYATLKSKGNESMVILCNPLWKHGKAKAVLQTATWGGVCDPEELSSGETFCSGLVWPHAIVSPNCIWETTGLLYHQNSLCWASNDLF